MRIRDDTQLVSLAFDVLDAGSNRKWFAQSIGGLGRTGCRHDSQASSIDDRQSAGSGILHDEVPTEAFTRNPTFSAMAYVLSGNAEIGDDRRPHEAHTLVLFGPGDHLVVGAAYTQPEDSPDLEILLLGGLPIGEPIAHHGPFLMNTRAEILQAVDDFQSGAMGSVPARS